MIDADYEVTLNGDLVKNEFDCRQLQATMNRQFATPGYSNNPLLTIKLPFINMNGVPIGTVVPYTTSKFKCKYFKIFNKIRISGQNNF